MQMKSQRGLVRSICCFFLFIAQDYGPLQYCLCVRNHIRDMKACHLGDLPGCPRMFYLVGALDRNSTTQIKCVTTSLPPCIWQWIDGASGRIQ